MTAPADLKVSAVFLPALTAEPAIALALLITFDDPSCLAAILLAHHQGHLQQIHRQIAQRPRQGLAVESHQYPFHFQRPFQGMGLQRMGSPIKIDPLIHAFPLQPLVDAIPSWHHAPLPSSGSNLDPMIQYSPSPDLPVTASCLSRNPPPAPP